MPIRKSSSAKTYALRLNPGLTCKKVRVDGCTMSGKIDVYQIFDGEKKIGWNARSSRDAWGNAYNLLDALVRED